MGDRERRRHKRYEVQGISGQLTYTIKAKILNMSIEGMSIETNRLINVDKSYIIILSNGTDTVELQGVVAWSNLVRTEHQVTGDVVPVFKAGIRFVDVLSDKAKRVLQFIDKNRILKLEHRLHGRFRIDSKSVRLGDPHDYTIKKISLSGMQIETDTMLEQGLKLDFTLILDEDNKIKTKGRVVSIHKDNERNRYYIGVEFINLTDKDKERLDNYLKKI